MPKREWLDLAERAHFRGVPRGVEDFSDIAIKQKHVIAGAAS